MSEQPAENTEKIEQRRCGIIMPISAMPNTNYTETHWKNVKDIIERAAKAVNFTPRMVSDSDQQQLFKKLSLITYIMMK